MLLLTGECFCDRLATARPFYGARYGLGPPSGVIASMAHDSDAITSGSQLQEVFMKTSISTPVIVATMRSARSVVVQSHRKE